MKKSIIIVSVLLLLVGIGIALFSMSHHGPSFDEVSHLLTPRITKKPSQNMLVVEATGDPNNTVGPAFGLLFKTWFKIKDRPKGKKMEAPRARWPKPFETPRDKWVGIYALPVPASLKSLPDVTGKNGLKPELREWQYGTVAEILHVGPYSSEDTSFAKLKLYISDNGYEICGDHEEEYLKGPGILPTNPEKYLTILRYEVRQSKTSIGSE
ncbi:MAG: GyrI-like domain-containing protein [Chitinispirillaceae bacterium]|nr:GyrI-like domain-containing protein [Chitinispirillaceae bacterium]